MLFKSSTGERGNGEGKTNGGKIVSLLARLISPVGVLCGTFINSSSSCKV
jgi:hypothetical protein